MHQTFQIVAILGYHMCYIRLIIIRAATEKMIIVLSILSSQVCENVMSTLLTLL